MERLAKKKKRKPSPGEDMFLKVLRRRQKRDASPIHPSGDEWYLQQRADINRRQAEARVLGRIRDSDYSVEDAMRETGATQEQMWEAAKDHTKHNKEP